MAMRVLRKAGFQRRYRRQQLPQASDRQAAGRWRWAATTQVGRCEGDEAGDAGVQPDNAGAPDLRPVGDLNQRQAQAVEWVGRVGDFYRRARKDRAADASSLLVLL
jgi:hypothetical protein